MLPEISSSPYAMNLKTKTKDMSKSWDFANSAGERGKSREGKKENRSIQNATSPSKYQRNTFMILHFHCD